MNALQVMAPGAGCLDFRDQRNPSGRDEFVADGTQPIWPFGVAPDIVKETIPVPYVGDHDPEDTARPFRLEKAGVNRYHPKFAHQPTGCVCGVIRPDMRPIFILSILPLLAAPAARTQTVSDTLDWRRYFPLEIGNEWHYRDAEAFPVTRLAIVGDTLIDDRLYFRATESVFELFFDSPAPTLARERDLFLAYGPDGIVAEFENPEDADGDPPPAFERGTAEFPNVDLRSAFGSTVDSDIDVAGNYEATIRIGRTELVVPAVKQFIQQAWQWSFAADIGFLGGGNLHGPVLEYARVGDVEVGSIVVSSEERPRASASRRGALFFFPNPARDMVNVAFDAEGHTPLQLELFDTTGRRVAVHELTDARSAGRAIDRIDVSWLISGAYLARVRSGERVIAGGSLVVWR